MGVFICQSCGTEQASWAGNCAKCGGTETIRITPQADNLLEKVINQKYRIVRRLGQGGMGYVYLAEQVGIGQRVALKFLKPEFSSDPEIARRFLNEAKSYGLVAHPNAVTLLDFGQDQENGNLFIAMEYCEGVDLKKMLQEKGNLSVADAVEVAMQTADVLGTAHAKGIVHRDLKPENIMVRTGMRGLHVKVMDFGIARLMNERTKLTLAGSIAGTPRYMSPEQVEGKEADHRADIYALGIVTFEALTGHQPFDGSTIAEILRNQVVQPLPLLSELAPALGLPDELDDVLQKACAKKREDRYPDMAAFGAAISTSVPTQMLLRPTATFTNVVHAASGTDADQRAQTQLGNASPPVRRGGGPLATDAALAAAQPTVPHQENVLERTLEGRGPPTDVEPAVQAPKSKGPMVAVVALVLLALAGGGYAAFSKDSDVPKDPVVEVRVPPPVDPLPTPPPDPTPVKPPPDAVVPLGAATQALDETAATNANTAGKVAFENGNLDAARTQFDSVKKELPQRAVAEDYLAKIRTIEETVRTADGYKSRGECEKALPLYDKALRVNPKVAGALSGRAACSAAQTPTQLE